MPKVTEVCRYVRSKNAGPFWITLDLFFADKEAYENFAAAPQLQPKAIAALYDVDASLVKHFPVPNLNVLKISFPRHAPQGGAMERDMHGGQQYVRIQDVQLDAARHG